MANILMKIRLQLLRYIKLNKERINDRLQENVSTSIAVITIY